MISLYDGNNVTDRFFVAGGFAEITPDRCTILADAVVPVAELTVDRAKARVEAGEKAWEDVDKQDITARDAGTGRAAVGARRAPRGERRLGKTALLFEKRSKNFCMAVAGQSATAVQEFFWSFLQKKNCFPFCSLLTRQMNAVCQD